MFQISALPSEQFRHLFGLSDDQLDALGVVVRTADVKPGYPCRVTLRDAEPGTRMLLLNYEHQDAATPYRSRHAIFVCDGAEDVAPAAGELPEQLRSRLLSVRAFSEGGMMVEADVVEGAGRWRKVLRGCCSNWRRPTATCISQHGCYAARLIGLTPYGGVPLQTNLDFAGSLPHQRPRDTALSGNVRGPLEYAMTCRDHLDFGMNGNTVATMVNASGQVEAVHFEHDGEAFDAFRSVLCFSETDDATGRRTNSMQGRGRSTGSWSWAGTAASSSRSRRSRPARSSPTR